MSISPKRLKEIQNIPDSAIDTLRRLLCLTYS